MNKPISKGDLVMVVRPSKCCGHTEHIGKPFTVSGLSHGGAVCSCGTFFDNMDAAFGCGGNFGIPLYMLLRIDPPPINEDAPAREELTV